MRFYDRFICLTLLIFLMVSFVSALLASYYNIYEYEEFLTSISLCYPNQDFMCLATTITNFDTANIMYFRILAFVFGVSSMFCGGIIVFIITNRKVFKNIYKKSINE